MIRKTKVKNRRRRRTRKDGEGGEEGRMQSRIKGKEDEAMNKEEMVRGKIRINRRRQRRKIAKIMIKRNKWRWRRGYGADRKKM